ncbi:hypothetical protein ACFY71_25680 [Streptomyces cinerochromogenes]|uniref:hypothetical protein n=1 Tax=Streptomyces cinerochromogenes TaxID=66422 RepID=UPI003675BC40
MESAAREPAVWEDDEYCLFVNATEGSPLWSLLADWTDGEDEEEWRRNVPRFSSLIAHWHRSGLIRLTRAEGWAYLPDAREVPTADVPSVLADPATRAYRESEEQVTCVALAVPRTGITGPPPRDQPG